MEYAIPYIILIGSYGLMALWYRKSKRQKDRIFCIVISLSVTLIFWGFRGFCFYDWMSYYPMYLELDVNSLANSGIGKVEPSFILLMTACKAFYNNYQFFVFVCSSINLTLLSRFLIRNTDNLPLGLMVCTVFGGLFLMTDLMRNAIATLIFINALIYIKEKKFIKYIILCLISISFHYSAILYIPAYFLLYHKTKKWVFATIFYVGCIVFALHIPIFTTSISLVLSFINPELEEKLRFYLLEVANKAPGIDIVFIERFITGTLVLCYMDKLRNIREDADLYINSILAYFFLTFYFGEFVTLSMRLALLFVCGYWIIWIDLIKCFSISNNRKLFIFFIGAYCMVRTLGLTKSVLANYDNILFNSETYQIRKSIFNKNYKDQ